MKENRPAWKSEKKQATPSERKQGFLPPGEIFPALRADNSGKCGKSLVEGWENMVKIFRSCEREKNKYKVNKQGHEKVKENNKNSFGFFYMHGTATSAAALQAAPRSLELLR